MIASQKGYIELVKLLLEQEKLDFNVRNIKLFYLEFIENQRCIKIIFGIHSNYLKHHL